MQEAFLFPARLLSKNDVSVERGFFYLNVLDVLYKCDLFVSRWARSSCLWRVIVKLTSGCGALRLSLCQRTSGSSCSPSLSDWLCWITSSETQVSTKGFYSADRSVVRPQLFLLIINRKISRLNVLVKIQINLLLLSSRFSSPSPTFQLTEISLHVAEFSFSCVFLFRSRKWQLVDQVWEARWRRWKAEGELKIWLG